MLLCIKCCQKLMNVEPAVPYAYTVYLENLSRNVILT